MNAEDTEKDRLGRELFWATRQGDYGKVQQLLQQGADINYRMSTDAIIAGATVAGTAGTYLGAIAIVPAMNVVGLLGLAIGGILGAGVTVIGGLFAAGAVAGVGMGGSIGIGGLYIQEFYALRGATPLHVASFYGFERLTRYLLQHGADVFAETRNGKTARLIACTYASPFGYYDRHMLANKEAIISLLRSQEDIVLADPRNLDIVPIRLAAVATRDRGYELIEDWNQIHIDPRVANSFLGQGAFGSVHRALWNRQKVAIKIALPVHALQNNFQRLYDQAVQEAEITSQAQNRLQQDQHLVRFYGIVTGHLPPHLAAHFQLAGQYAIGLIFRYEEGGSLDQFLLNHREFPLQERLRLLVEIASTLSELHGIGLIHGDLKPSNILLSGEVSRPIAKIADFGLARHLVDLPATQMSAIQLTQTPTTCTYLYAAPEMLPNPFSTAQPPLLAKPSRSTDIYAFAMICYEVLSLRKPFDHLPYQVTDFDLPRIVHAPENNRPPIQERGVFPDIVPSVLIKLIQDAWQADRSNRPSALACWFDLDCVYERLSSQHWDLFFSHAWRNKPFLRHVLHRLFRTKGFHLWYDEENMGSDLKGSMVEGVRQSKAFLACVSPIYQERPNCMFEIQEAARAQKPVIALVLHPNPTACASDKLKDYCRFEDMMYVDFSELEPEDDCWADNHQNQLLPHQIPVEKMELLDRKVDELARLLQGRNVYPSLNL